MSEGNGERSRDVVVMGASAGGLEVLSSIVGGLPEDFPAAVTIVQHRPPHASNLLRDLLARETKLPVVWAEQGDRHEPGRVYLAPPDLHLTFSDGHFNLTASARENHARPSINRLFRSAAAQYGSRTIGVLLSGLLDDGVAGLVAISRVGGQTVVQDPATATAPELPRNGIAAVPTSRVTPAHEIAGVLVEAVASRAPRVEVPEQIRLESELDLSPASTEELDRIGERADTRCSECGGPMWRVADGGPLRYRCYLGHAMSAQDRLAKYDGEIEAAMWNAVRALNERSTTYESLALDALRRHDESAAKEFMRSARATQDQARLAYEFMQRLTARR